MEKSLKKRKQPQKDKSGKKKKKNRTLKMKMRGQRLKAFFKTSRKDSSNF